MVLESGLKQTRRLVVHKMNIFYLDEKTSEAAKLHCDKHVVKMIVEYGQLLSTAHRVLDGELYIDSSSGRKIKRWQHPDSDFEANLYKACKEYTHRYRVISSLSKDHATYIKLGKYLASYPVNLPFDKDATAVPQCMPDDVKSDDPVDAYQNYYIKYKKDFARWTNRPVPKFMEAA